MSEHQIDFDRHSRLGFPEVIYGATKSTAALEKILLAYRENNTKALVTKLQADKANVLLTQFSDSFYDSESGVFLLDGENKPSNPAEVAIVSAGLSDLSVANEAYFTLNFLGVAAEKFTDVGVAGIHRILNKAEQLKAFKVLIVIAGFEGALPSVIGGLFAQPIIAVPTSIGYGVTNHGQTALNAMLSSCANGIVVVNIDNGYGAATAAFRMLRRHETQAARD